MRLTKALDNFKKNRDELKTLVTQLTQNINQADTAIKGLRNASDNAARDLEDVLHDARRMADELKMINETGDALASRLEKAATKGRAAASGPAANHEMSEREYLYGADEDEIEEDAAPSFFIKDTEYERDAGKEGGADNDDFSSQAERELYEALQQNQKKKAGGQS